MRPRFPVALTAAVLMIAGTASAIATAGSAGASPATSHARQPGHGTGPEWHGSAPRAAVGRDVRNLAANRLHASARTSALSPKVTADSGTSATVEVTVSGDTNAVTDAVAAAKGKIVAAVPGKVTAEVPRSALARLASSSGVDAVDKPVRGFTQSTATSEGVAASNAGPATTAGTWHNAGTTGAGVNVAIVDAGFEGLAAAVAAGDLPAGLTVTGDHCADVDAISHGTAVTEIVHQMAPGANLHLYCVDDAVGLKQAESELQVAGDTIVNCSLGFPGDARGDGNGSSTSAAVTVRTARQAGILWVQSAGNSATDHWSGTLADANADTEVDLNGSAVDNEWDGVFVAGTDDAGPAGGHASLLLQWDQWPISSAPIEFAAFGWQCTDTDCTTGYDLGEQYIDQPAGTAPWLELDVDNNAQYDQEWDVYVFVDTGFPKVHYDLSYLGDVFPSYLSSVNAARAASGSISAPADSPYAFAVGAADVGVDGATPGTLEPFSSRGPTIDSRVKPDITGWDGVSSPVYGVPTPDNFLGFYGTSAASPHVAGAAALVAAANSNLDAAQIQNFLQQRASSGSPKNPPTNALGHGLLTLGTPADVVAPTGAGYEAITPKRILDTRTTTGGHKAPLGAGATLQLSVPGLPADATAVAINLTGTGVTGTTYLSAYPGGTAYPNTSNVNLTKLDSTAAVFAIVTVRNGAITIRNAAGTANVVVDELGYFGTGAETGRLTSLSAAHRVLDTRTIVGNHHSKLVSGGTVTINPGVPPGATAAVVNLTATGMASGGHVGAAPACSSASSTLNYGKYTRANLAIVKLSALGRFCIQASGGAVDLIVDVQGYISASGSDYVALPSPGRVVDTRTGNGGLVGARSPRPLGSATTSVLYGSNVGVVPASATALFTNVVEATATNSGYLTLFPGRTKPSPLTSNLNFSPGRTVSNAVIATLPAASATVADRNRVGIYNSNGNTNVVVDVFGYFRAASG